MQGSLFVTGGRGYIGGHLLASLGGLPYRKIICLTRMKPPTTPGIEFVQADLLQTSTYAPCLYQCDTVLHMAAATGKSKAVDFFQINRVGTQSLVDECRRAGVRRIIYISTIAAKFRDQSRYYYAQSKRQAEEVVVASGLTYTIVRPTIVIGQGAPVLEGLSRLAAAAVLPIFGSGRALVQPVFVGDLATGLIEILKTNVFDNRLIEIGGPQVLTMETLLTKIRHTRGRGNGPVLHLPAGPIAAFVGLLERPLLPLLPFTAGQIASFVNDGTAAPDPVISEWQTRMKDVDQMLASKDSA